MFKSAFLLTFLPLRGIYETPMCNLNRILSVSDIILMINSLVRVWNWQYTHLKTDQSGLGTKIRVLKAHNAHMSNSNSSVLLFSSKVTRARPFIYPLRREIVIILPIFFSLTKVRTGDWARTFQVKSTQLPYRGWNVSNCRRQFQRMNTGDGPHAIKLRQRLYTSDRKASFTHLFLDKKKKKKKKKRNLQNISLGQIVGYNVVSCLQPHFLDISF